MGKRFCTNCGAENRDEEKFCTACGEKLSAPTQGYSVASYTDNQPTSGYAQNPRSTSSAYGQPPIYGGGGSVTEEIPPTGLYAPITTLQWIGIMLLLLIPLVNVILLIVWACGGCRKATQRSFARAALIGIVVCFLLSLLLGYLAKQAFASFVNSAGFSDLISKSIAQEIGIDPALLEGLDLGDLVNQNSTSGSNITGDAAQGLQEAQELLDYINNNG